MSSPTQISNDYVHALDRQYVFHSWSTQGALNPLVIAGGEGCTLWDYNGKRYLDFSSQLVNTNIGHQHPKVIAAIQEQAGSLVTIAPATANLMRGEAAKRILARAPRVGKGFSDFSPSWSITTTSATLHTSKGGEIPVVAVVGSGRMPADCND